MVFCGGNNAHVELQMVLRRGFSPSVKTCGFASSLIRGSQENEVCNPLRFYRRESENDKVHQTAT